MNYLPVSLPEYSESSKWPFKRELFITKVTRFSCIPVSSDLSDNNNNINGHRGTGRSKDDNCESNFNGDLETFREQRDKDYKRAFQFIRYSRFRYHCFLMLLLEICI